MAADDGNRTGSEVVFEILKRVPARSLCRFRCVSKLWQSIIADRGFMSTHWAHSRSYPKQLAAIPCSCHPHEPEPNPRGRGYRYGHDSDRIWLQLYGDIPHDDSSLLRINLQPPPAAALTGLALENFNGLGWEWERMPPSVGGLICLADDCIKICNPSTWEYVALPYPTSDPLWYRWTSLCFDPIANEHKVLLFDGVVYRVFAPGSGTSTSWRRLQGVTPYAERLDRDEVCLNGILYYVARGRFMAKFHVHSERFDVMSSVDLDSLSGTLRDWQWKLVEYLIARVAIVQCPRFDKKYFSAPPPADYKDTIRLWVLEAEEEHWILHKLVLPPKEILPRRGKLYLAGSIHAGEDLVFLWTIDAEDPSCNFYNTCLFYNSKKETFSRLVRLSASVPSGLNRPYYPLYTPEVEKLSLSDHEDNLLALEAFKLAIN